MSSEAYQGAQDQGSALTDYNALSFLVRQELAKLSTATLVRIVRGPYDASGAAIPPGTAGPVGFVDVLPLVNQIDGRGNATPHETVYRLSYHRYQSGGGAFIADPVVGDIGKMVVADRDTSSVRATSRQANPGSRRKFDMADGTYFGCTQAGAPSQWFAWTATGFAMQDKNGNTIVGGPTGVTINGCLINKSGDVITKAGHDLDTHVHGGVTTGSSDTGPPV